MVVEIGLGQRIAGVVGLARARRQRHPRDALPGQGINHRHPGERHVAGIGHRHRVVEHVANRVGQRIAIAARHIQEYLVDGDRRSEPTSGTATLSDTGTGLVGVGRRRIVDVVVAAAARPSRSAWVSV